MQNNQTINQLKSLVSFIAHESRNSVAVIKGSCEIVKENLININLENDFTFFGDETLVIYVLFNLLKNALHYRVKSDIFIAKVQKL